MSSVLSTVKEWINPAWGRHRTVPPMESGMRPNLRLDQAEELFVHQELEPDGVAVTTDGVLAFSSGDRVFVVRDGRPVPLATLPGPVTALAVHGAEVLAAVEGHGIVSIASSGAVAEICAGVAVAACVTDLASLPDGGLLATVGSRSFAASEWARALVAGDRSGALVRVDGTRAEVVAEGLGWPAGVCADGPDTVAVSLSLEHRVEARSLGTPTRRGRPLAGNLPVYPGRLRAAADGYWVAAPYVRNRVTEMLLDEPALLREMTAMIDPDEWFVPRLRAGNPFTETMQMGQLRVLGVVKSWAPARSCGIVFRVDGSGRIAESAHARVDSPRHGVTGLAVRSDDLVVAARGYGNLLRLEARN